MSGPPAVLQKEAIIPRNNGLEPAWPVLDYPAWRNSALTLQLWMQIIGKIRLVQTPWLNHSWHVPFYVSSRGLQTSPIPFGRETVDVEFDFVGHRLLCRASIGSSAALDLKPMSVASFHREVMSLFERLGCPVRISHEPSEFPDPIPFDQDHTHADYDASAVHRFWRALLHADNALKLFRTGFLGKASPVHFFWGGFDLAVTRFSGRKAPSHPGGIPGLSDHVTREAYSHEVSSAGFWPGSDRYPDAAFYAYAYPEPAGFRDWPVAVEARYVAELGEFILPYRAVQAALDPDGSLQNFLEATYAAAATLGKWDRSALECVRGQPGKPRPL
ncbi:MAG: DUF5996 family protein [Methylovirgula sp.]